METGLENYPEVLNANEVQKILRLSRNGIYNAVAEGVIPHFKVGRRVRIPKSGIIALIEAAARKRGIEEQE